MWALDLWFCLEWVWLLKFRRQLWFFLFFLALLNLWFVTAKRKKILCCYSKPQGPAQSEQDLPVTLKGTLGKTLYEKLNAKLSDGRKVSLVSTGLMSHKWMEGWYLGIFLKMLWSRFFCLLYFRCLATMWTTTRTPITPGWKSWY